MPTTHLNLLGGGRSITGELCRSKGAATFVRRPLLLILRPLLVVVLIAAGCSSRSNHENVSDDWPQFLGPNRDGTVSVGDIARSWPADGPRLLWTVDVGPGFGGASIRDGEVFLLDRPNDEQDVLRSLRLESGEELWRIAFDAPGRLDYNGSRSTPAVDEDRVYAIGPLGDVYCIDRAARREVWRLNLRTAFRAEPPPWGFAHSPLLVRDMVIVLALGEEQGVVALDRAGGEVVWKSPPIGGGSYVSPTLRTVAGAEMVLAQTASQVVGLNPDTGEVLWNYGEYLSRMPAPVPTAIGNGRVFLTGGSLAGSVMLEVKRDGRAFSVSELFRIVKRGSQIHPALFHGNHLYANFNVNEDMSEGLVCINLKGNIKWQTKKSPDIDRGNLIIVGDLMLTMHGQNGELALIDPEPSGYRELARAKVLDGEDGNIWGPMAFARGRLVVRDQKQMRCLDLSKP